MKLENIDLSDIEFWAKPWNERNDAFATLRRENPIAYFPEPIIDPFPEGPGYYAITKMHDILEISRHPEVFCSGQGAVSILDMPAEMNFAWGATEMSFWLSLAIFSNSLSSGSSRAATAMIPKRFSPDAPATRSANGSSSAGFTPPRPRSAVRFT